MASRGSRTYRIKRQEQFEALASPVRMEIVGVFHGRQSDLSVGDIARVLGASRHAIHYHVRRLVEAGLLVEADERPVKGQQRTETVYRLIRPQIEMSFDPKIEGCAEALGKAAAAMLRTTEREAKSALSRGDVVDYGPKRNYHVGRMKVWLSDSALRELNHLLDQIEELFRREGPKKQGALYMLTLALLPLEDSTGD